MLTELQKRKLTRQFELYDIDGDRAITRQDFEKLFLTLMRAKGLLSSSEVGQALHQKLMGTWQTIVQSVEESVAMTPGSLSLGSNDLDSRQSGEKRISQEAFLASHQVFLGSLSDTHAALDVLADLTLAMYDTNGDGTITEDDFLKVAGAHGGDLNAARSTFSRLDLNGNGELALDEVKTLVQQFYLNEDPLAPGCWLFGPL